MSLQTTTYVFKRSYGNQTRKLIMLCIADYTGDDTGTAWAYIDTLAHRAECSRRSVQVHLDSLERDGELEIYRNAGPQGSHRFRILFRKNHGEQSPPAGGAESAPRSDERVQNPAKGCRSRTVKQQVGGADDVTPFAPKTILTIRERTEREKTPARADQFSEIFRATLDRINSLRPEWTAAPGYSKRERLAFMDNAQALEAVAAEHWETVRRYLAARLPQGSAGFQPVSREQFLAASNDVLARALQWDRKQARPAERKATEPIQTPEEQAKAEQELAEWLSEQKTLTPSAR